MRVSNIEVKKTNQIRVYRILLKNSKIPRQEIAFALNMSLPTVAQNIKELSEMGLVVEDGQKASTGGRKASTVSCVPNARIAIGIDITQNHIGFAAVNLQGEVLAHVRTSKKYSNADEYYRSASELAIEFIERNKIAHKKILGVGLSMPGIVSDDGSTLLRSNLLGISGAVQNEFAMHLPFDTRLFNDATAASIAEVSKTTDLRDMVFLSLSNSVGGAVLCDGKQVLGNNQRSGEFGHICIEPKGVPCYCGKAGHFDSYCSALVLAEAGGGKLENFFKKLESKDTECEKIFEKYIRYLAIMISNLRMSFDCDIVLGGYVGSHLGPYLAKIRTKVADLDTFDTTADYVSLCKYKTEASAVGAAIHYIDAFIDNL